MIITERQADFVLLGATMINLLGQDLLIANKISIANKIGSNSILNLSSLFSFIFCIVIILGLCHASDRAKQIPRNPNGPRPPDELPVAFSLGFMLSIAGAYFMADEGNDRVENNIIGYTFTIIADICFAKDSMNRFCCRRRESIEADNLIFGIICGDPQEVEREQLQPRVR